MLQAINRDMIYQQSSLARKVWMLRKPNKHLSRRLASSRDDPRAKKKRRKYLRKHQTDSLMTDSKHAQNKETALSRFRTSDLMTAIVKKRAGSGFCWTCSLLHALATLLFSPIVQLFTPKGRIRDNSSVGRCVITTARPRGLGVLIAGYLTSDCAHSVAIDCC